MYYAHWVSVHWARAPALLPQGRGVIYVSGLGEGTFQGSGSAPVCKVGGGGPSPAPVSSQHARTLPIDVYNRALFMSLDVRFDLARVYSPPQKVSVLINLWFSTSGRHV